MYKIENLIFKTNDPVKFHQPGFRKRYYNHYKINDTRELVDEYIKSISWISQYYLNGIPDWSFYYKFDIAPLSEDLIRYFNPSLLNFKFEIHKPLSPIEQLSCVLHPLSFYLLPPILKIFIYKIINYFLKKVKIDMINKSKYFKCIPILPDFNISYIKNTVNQNLHKLSYLEKKEIHYKKNLFSM